MTTEELCVIAFDVASDRRRYRLTRILEGYGHRVQESVFEAWLDEAQHQRLLDETSSVPLSLRRGIRPPLISREIQGTTLHGGAPQACE